MSEMKDLTYSRGNESFRQTSYAQNCKGPGGGGGGFYRVVQAFVVRWLPEPCGVVPVEVL